MLLPSSPESSCMQHKNAAQHILQDGRVTVRLLIKYLAAKLGLEDESEVEITCRGRPLPAFLTLQHVRDGIWCQGDAAASPSVAPPDMPAANHHLMVLQYGRRP